MDHIEVPFSDSRHFGSNLLRRGDIKLRRGKHFLQTRSVICSQEDNKIDVVSEARFTIQNGGHASGNDITNSEPIQGPNEQERKIRFGHLKKYA